MTFNEIYEKVSHLGFDTDLEDFREQFIDAVNRGFKQVTRRMPRMGQKIITLEESIRTNGMAKIDIKEAINGKDGGEYKSLPQNPVRTRDGELCRTDCYRMLNKDTILFLQNAENGEYIIDYIRNAQKFNHNDFESDNDLDLDEELCEALVLYVAYYVLLDDSANAELAATYLARYNEMMNEIIYTHVTHAPNGYQIVKRW